MTTKKKPTTDLVVAGESGFAILDDPNAHSIVLSTIRDLGVTAFEMDRVKIPSGGGVAWEVETLSGTEVEKELVVTILIVKGNQKSWWRESYGTGESGPPDCMSTDGITGRGINSLEPDAIPGEHACSECHWNQFGSTRGEGKGKDCADTALMFFFNQESRLPSLLVVPPTSLKAVRTYALKLIGAGLDVCGVLTRMRLEKVADSFTYSRLVLEHAGTLDAAATRRMAVLRDEFSKALLGYTPHATAEG